MRSWWILATFVTRKGMYSKILLFNKKENIVSINAKIFSLKLVPYKMEFMLSKTSLKEFVAFFLWLNGWLHHIWCVILLNDIMDLHMLNLGTLVTQASCSVFYATRGQFTNIYHMIWFFANTVIWYYTLINEDMQHIQRPIDWNTHIAPSVMFSQQAYL